MKYLIKGELYNPIKFGEEDSDWVGDGENPTCGDCGVHVGEQHLPACDTEICPCCGGQMLSCDCGVIYEITNESEEEIKKLIEKQKEENIENEIELEEALAKYNEKNHKSDSEM